MHIKFISTGKGSASAAKDYLLQEHDHKGEIRADVQVLRGNPDHVTQLAESLEFKHKYTSGVIAWHVDDNPSAAQIDQVLDDFERVAFAGLEPNQYTYYAVLHEESNGAKHIHIITPRVELQSGLSMNIAPPNHQKTYDVLVDKYNVKHNWASPKDISRQKTMTIDKMQIHADTPNVKAKQMIHEVINELVGRGSIKNNADVRMKLAEFGEITREGKEYISVKPKGFKKSVRLKGAYYERKFSVERTSKEVRAEQEARIRTNQADRNREYERVSKVFENIIEDRAKFNQRRYIPNAEEHQQKQQNFKSEQRNVQQRDSTELSEREPRTHEDKSQAMDNPHNNGFIDSLSPSVGNISSDKALKYSTQNTSRTGSEKRRSRSIQSSKKDVQNTNRSVSETTAVANKKWHLDNRTQGIENDAIRERIKSNFEDTRRDVLERIKKSRESVRERIEEDNADVQRRSAKHNKSEIRYRTADIFAEVEQLSSEIAKRIKEYRLSKAITNRIRQIRAKLSSLISDSREIEKGLYSLKNGTTEQMNRKAKAKEIINNAYSFSP